MTDSSTTLLVDDFAYGEGPRWHDGRLWFTDGPAGAVNVVEDGRICRVVDVPHASGLGWLADGTMVVCPVGEAAVVHIGASTTVRHELGHLAFAQMYTGQNVAALRSAELAQAASEARDDEFSLVNALCAEGGALAALDEHDRSTAVVSEALRRAAGTGHPMAIGAAVITAASQHLMHTDSPGFVASLDILSRHDVDLDRGDLNGMWLEITWGLTLVGLEQPAAVGHLANAARAADRLDAPSALDYALRPLAIVAADAGLHEQAGGLVAFAEAQLRAHRIETPFQVWIQTRLDRALAGFSAAAPAAPLHRREIMDLVTQIETALTRDQSEATA